MPQPSQDQLNILAAVQTQIADLQAVNVASADKAIVEAELDKLVALLGGLPVPAEASAALAKMQALAANPKSTIADYAQLLVMLDSIQALTLDPDLTDVVRTQVATGAANIRLHTRQVMNARPDVDAVMGDLAALKNLGGGPADAVAFHDFQVLQIAFKSVWMHAFNGDLKVAAAQLYGTVVQLYDEAGLAIPDFGAIDDMETLLDLISQLSNDKALNVLNFIAPPDPVSAAFPQVASIWPAFSQDQQLFLQQQAEIIVDPNSTAAKRKQAQLLGQAVIDEPAGTGGRLMTLLARMQKMLSAPYAFDVFAPDSFNYGILATYRQRWEPLEYQAGDLVATIPLAPGETRKITTKRVVKSARAVKEAEKSVSTRSEQTSDVGRAESEIIDKVTSATNFKLTAKGSFNIGIGSIESTSEFGGNQQQDSTATKRAFHEATIKAAEEYRQERSVEVDTTNSVEAEQSSAIEISNPNNEITVTYLYYELQRRYLISEFLYRVRPVIMVALDVPAPHEIDEAWLIANQWMIARVLLDESLRPALQYLTSGFAGDELSVDVLKVQWQQQRDTVIKLEGLVDDELAQRDRQRSTLVDANLNYDTLPSMPGALKIFTMGMDPSDQGKKYLRATMKAGETRLKYIEEALADAQEKLKDANESFERTTSAYTAALQNMYSRHVAIDQLCLHLQQNMLFYMQAIWDFRVRDQRFFELYKKKVFCPEPEPNCTPGWILHPQIVRGRYPIEFKNICVPSINGGVGGFQHELVEVADIDNPLGYKGNYIIFPLKDECYLTTYMILEFVNQYLADLDADNSEVFDAASFEAEWKATVAGSPERDLLRQQLIQYIESERLASDEIVVPTGQLFVEALPGTHPLLEDYKLLSRLQDTRMEGAKVRHAELENLRLAARLVLGQDNDALLQDPEIDQKIVIEGGVPLVVAGS